MANQKKKRKAWKWLIGAVIIAASIIVGLRFVSPQVVIQQYHTYVPSGAKDFVQSQYEQGKSFAAETFQQGKNWIQNVEVPKFQLKDSTEQASSTGDIQANAIGKVIPQKQLDVRGQGHHEGKFSGHMYKQPGIHDHHGFGIGAVLLALGSLVLGYYFRKARENKWLGNVLIALGLLPIWPLAIVGFIVFFVFKKLRSHTATEIPAFTAVNHDVMNNAKFLDEWERTAKKGE